MIYLRSLRISAERDRLLSRVGVLCQEDFEENCAGYVYIYLSQQSNNDNEYAGAPACRWIRDCGASRIS